MGNALSEAQAVFFKAIAKHKNLLDILTIFPENILNFTSHNCLGIISAKR